MVPVHVHASSVGALCHNDRQIRGSPHHRINALSIFLFREAFNCLLPLDKNPKRHFVDIVAL